MIHNQISYIIYQLPSKQINSEYLQSYDSLKKRKKKTQDEKSVKYFILKGHFILFIIIIMKTIYIAPKNQMNGTLGASQINSFCTQTTAINIILSDEFTKHTPVI